MEQQTQQAQQPLSCQDMLDLRSAVESMLATPQVKYPPARIWVNPPQRQVVAAVSPDPAVRQTLWCRNTDYRVRIRRFRLWVGADGRTQLKSYQLGAPTSTRLKPCRRTRRR